MSHHIYHTNAIIIGSKPQGEANKILSIYTRELGLVNATVQGIRYEKSKLRFALQDFSLAQVDLVRGREVWRVTSATTQNLFPFIRKDSEALLIFARLAKLIERLMPGETAHEKIFDDILQGLSLLDNEIVEKETIEAIELYLVLRIVYELGYVGDSEIINEHLGGNFDPNNASVLLSKKRSIVLAINTALSESHL